MRMEGQLTGKDVELRELYKTHTARQIAEIYNVPKSLVKGSLNRMEIKKRQIDTSNLDHRVNPLLFRKDIDFDIYSYRFMFYRIDNDI